MYVFIHVNLIRLHGYSITGKPNFYTSEKRFFTQVWSSLWSNLKWLIPLVCIVVTVLSLVVYPYFYLHIHLSTPCYICQHFPISSFLFIWNICKILIIFVIIVLILREEKSMNEWLTSNEWILWCLFIELRFGPRQKVSAKLLCTTCINVLKVFSHPE